MQDGDQAISQIEAASGFTPGAERPNRSASSQQDFLASASDFLREYSRSRPEVVALWAFGVGFILGWKLKPW